MSQTRTPLKIGIIGGSIAGCSSAILLERLGAEVTIFERSAHPLVSRGAGIILPEALLQQCIALNLLDANIPCINSFKRAFFEKSRFLLEQSAQAFAFNWSDLYQNLRKRISKQSFLPGEEVVSITEDEDNCHIKTKKSNQYRFDLVVAADGVDSIVRKIFFPAYHPQYAGYVAWRGITEISSTLEKELFPVAASYYVFHHGHLLFYLIPGPDFNQSGKKLLNWLLYEEIINPDGSTPTSQPPGSLSKEQINHLHHLAKRELPAHITEIICKTEKPFLQAIFDLQTPQCFLKRICLIGDARSITRPHSASGVLKSLNDSISLAQALTNHLHDFTHSLKEWSRIQTAKSEQEVTLAKTMGQALVTHTPDWKNMDRAWTEKWWAEVMSGKKWYAMPGEKTSPPLKSKL